MLHHARLDTRTIIRTTGADVLPFLQGLLTADVLHLETGSAAYGLLLSPQGRYVHDMFVLKHGDEIFLDVEASQADMLLKTLKLFKLRRDVGFEIAPPVQAMAVWGNDSAETPPTHGFPDPRLPALGYRLYAESSDLPIANSTEQDYNSHRIALAVADHHDMVVHKTLPLEMEMDDLHAVNFTKGCYVGQEVTARMHYKATPRRGVYHAKAEQTLPPIGTPIMYGDAIIGELKSTAGNQAIAWLKHESVAAAGDEEIFARAEGGDAPLSIARPAWAKPVLLT